MFENLNWYYFKYEVDNNAIEVSGMELVVDKHYFYPQYIRFDLVGKCLHIDTCDTDVSIDLLKAIQ